MNLLCSLAVKGHGSILEALDSYTKEEMMKDDNKYDAGKFGYQDAKKVCIIIIIIVFFFFFMLCYNICTLCVLIFQVTRFLSLPPVLHIQLLRMEFDLENGRMGKIHDYCSFPVLLDMNKYMMDLTDEQREIIRRNKESAKKTTASSSSPPSEPSTSTDGLNKNLQQEQEAGINPPSDDSNCVLDTKISDVPKELLEKFRFLIPEGRNENKQEMIGKKEEDDDYIIANVEENRNEKKTLRKIDYRYTLHSVLVHRGSFQGGYEKRKTLFLLSVFLFLFIYLFILLYFIPPNFIFALFCNRVKSLLRLHLTKM
jgi:hypothetical protein